MLPETELGGPGTPRDPGQGDTESPPPGTAATGHPGHDPALAPRHPPPPLGGPVQARQDRRPATRQNIQALASGWPGRIPDGATAGSTANWLAWE